LVVLADWEDAQERPRLTIAIAPDDRFSFAAVAVADGWLLVQI
jgi:hypothetical protein